MSNAPFSALKETTMKLRKSEMPIAYADIVNGAVMAAAETVAVVRCHKSGKFARRECIGSTPSCKCRLEARIVLAEHGLKSPETEAGIPGFVF